jgi:hypothetical protein
MHAPEPTPAVARRELVLVATLLVGLSALVDPADAFVLAGLLPVAVLLAGLGVLKTSGAPSRPYAALLLPAVLTGAAAAGVHLVPAGLWLIVVVAAFAIVLDRVVKLEARIVLQVSGASESDRSQVLAAAVATAFLAFTGVAALIPGGMPEPAGSPVAGSSTMTQGWLAVLALGDALVALVIGWRISALRFGAPLGVARSAITYALVIAISAGLVRAIDLPRLVGPAVLTLVFYLWDAQHASAPARRRERRFVLEMLLLAGLAVLVVTWNALVPS